jgi:hypothetical protein
MSEQLVRYINFGIAGSAPQVPASGKRLYLLPNGDFATIDASGVVTSLATRWEAITGKPTEFPPEPHLSSKITDFAAAVVAAAPPTTNASLLTTGTLPDARLAATIARTADLTTEQNARIAGDAALSTRIDFLASNLDPAALDSIAEAAASIGSLQTEINGKAPFVHTHTASQITDFAAAVVASAPELSITTTTHTADGLADTYSVSGIASANPSHVIVSLNGVTQSPGTDYTVNLATGKIIFDDYPSAGQQIVFTALGLRSVQRPIDPTLYIYAFDQSSNGLTTYSGRLLNADRPAAPALPETATSWTIRRSTLNAAGRVLATASATGSWLNRETLSYA